MQRIAPILIVIALTAVFSAACSGPEEKKAKFFTRGESLYEQGDYVRARLEFKNALQIDPKFARAYHMLGMVEMKEQNFRKAFGYFNKAVEIDPNFRDAHLEMGKLFLAANALDRARETAERLLMQRPEDHEALILTAGILMAEKRYDEAQRQLVALKDGGFHDRDVYFMLASLYARQEERARAENILQEGIAANPSAVALHLALVRLYTVDREYDKAITAIANVIALEPDQTAHKLSLAGLYRQNGNIPEMQHLLQGLMAEQPENEDIRIQVAQFYARNGNLEQAEAALQKGLGAVPDSVKLRLAHGDILARARQPEEAIRVLEDALKQRSDPADPEILQVKIALARIYMHRYHNQRAENLINEVLQESPNKLDALMVKGRLRLLDGDGLNAIGAFRTVTAEKPEFIPAHIQLSQAHLVNGEPALALDTLQQGLKVNPQSTELRLALAHMYASRKAFGQAEGQLRKILAADADNHQVRARLGDLLTADGRLDAAAKEYRVIESRAPNLPAGYIKQAQLHLRRRKADQALKVLETGFKRNPDSVPLFTSLVGFHMAQKNYEQAETLCREMVGRYPDHPIPLNALGDVLTIRKDYAQARQCFEKAITLQPMWQPPYHGLARIYLAQGKTAEAIAKLEAALR